MTVAVVADTHVPDREDGTPGEFRERVRAADHVIHAGDLTGPAMLAEVRELADDPTVVTGNMDEDLDLPVLETVTVEAVTFVVTHGHLGVRTAEDWKQAIADAARIHAAEPRVGIGAHSHEVVDEEFQPFADTDFADEVPAVRVLNPGSATGADPAERATMMTVEIEDGSVAVTVHEA